MRKISIISIAILATASLSYTPVKKETWTLDKNHAKVSFTVTHLMVSEVEGWFKTFDAKLTTTTTDFTNAEAEMTAVASSINTDIEQRDTHLKSSDFFDVATYPTIVFKSKTFKKLEGANYVITGDLTMHGITKTIELAAICRTGKNPATDKTIAGIKTTGTIKRSDFNIGPSMGSAMISDEVSLVANAEFIKD